MPETRDISVDCLSSIDTVMMGKVIGGSWPPPGSDEFHKQINKALDDVRIKYNEDMLKLDPTFKPIPPSRFPELPPAKSNPPLIA